MMKWDPIAIANSYAERGRCIRRLASQEVVHLAEISGMDRLGLCEVANQLWTRCSPDARHHLLQHEHPHVRSCAAIAAQATA